MIRPGTDINTNEMYSYLYIVSYLTSISNISFSYMK